MSKESHSKEHNNISIEIQDAIDDLEQGIGSLKQTVSCIHAAVQFDAEDSGNYMEGVLSVLLLVVKDLSDKVHSLSCAVSEGDKAR